MSADDDRRIGETIRALRKERGMSQRELAYAMRAAGRSHWRNTVVSKVELGDRQLHWREVQLLSQLFGCEVVPGVGRGERVGAADLLERQRVEEKLRHALDMLAEAERAVWEALG